MPKRGLVALAVALILAPPTRLMAEPTTVTSGACVPGCTTNVVPEPIALGLFATGIMGLLATGVVYVRRRRKTTVA
jgi:hypothetical protein